MALGRLKARLFHFPQSGWGGEGQGIINALRNAY